MTIKICIEGMVYDGQEKTACLAGEKENMIEFIWKERARGAPFAY